MRAGHIIVMILLMFVLAEGFMLVLAESTSPKRHHTLKNSDRLKQGSKVPSYKPNSEFVRRLANKWFTTEDKARKHSEVAVGSGMMDDNRMSQQHDGSNSNGNVGNTNKVGTPTASQTPHLMADYGILGISDDEDSAKWAYDEMKKAAANKAKTTTEKVAQNVTVVTKMPKQISTQNASQGLQTFVKIAPVNRVEENGTEMNKTIQVSDDNTTNGGASSPDFVPQSMSLPESGKLPKNGPFLNVSEVNNIISKVTQAGLMTQNTTMNITLTNVQFLNTNTTVNHTGKQPIAPQGIALRIQNGPVPNATVYQTASNATQSNVPGNGISAESKPKTEESKTTSTGMMLLSNQTQNSQQLPAQGTAPSLTVNITNLRKEQSFDLQLPTSLPSKGTFNDNHFHLGQNDTFRSSDYSPQDLESNSSNTNFLNAALDKVIAEEQEKGRQPNNILQKLNSEIVGSRAQPLNNNVNVGDEVTDETFREEPATGRTFSENLMEPNSNDQRPGSPQMPENQAEIQQDESLARALNSSSVSSIIFSANRAIFDNDNKVFSKKSAQGRLNTKDKEHRNKRGTLLRHLTKKNSLPTRLVSGKIHTPRKPRNHHRDVTSRQVINLGNHFLWFGGQSSADANGFPRHNTATENSPYNVNNYMSKFLETDNKNEAASATKGYKALQSAISSMESQQDGQSDPTVPDLMYTVPSNQELQNSDHAQNPASVVIQDNAGKPVYQGVVDIVKLNNTKSNESVSSESGNQNNNILSGQKDDALNKENNTANSSQMATTGINNTINPNVEHQDSSNDGNQTVTQGVGSMGNVGKTNSTEPTEGTSGQNIQAIQGIQQEEQSQNTTQQLPSLVQDNLKSPNETLGTMAHLQNTQEPSAIIKKISSNPEEPETYHVIVNDAGKKITNANGHVTVIISGPTATQASMPDENTLLIPQTNPSNWSPENNQNNYVGSKENTHVAMSDHPERDHSVLQSLNMTSGNNTSLNKNNTNGIATLSLLQNDIVPALKISEGIEEQLKKGQADGLQSAVNSQNQMLNQSKQASDLHSKANQTNTLKTENTDAFIQNGNSFVNVGQDLTGGVDGLQMEEVSRPNIQPEQQKEQQNLLEGPAGGYMEAEDQYAGAMQSQDVPTLNIVLNPMQKIHGSLSVGGKVIPISSAKESDYNKESGQTGQAEQQLDCHAEPQNGKTKSTVLTCQKKQNLANIPQYFSNLQSLPTQGTVYYGKPQMNGNSALQLNQVMNVLNDQVKATINNEMKTESKDIEKVLAGMTMPSSELMDTDEAESQSEPPQRTSLMDTDENLTSPPEIEQQTNKRHQYHQKMRHFGFPFHFGFPHHFGFHQPQRVPHRRHFWGYKHHSNPFVVMAHPDHSNEGFWDYQHNIFIPRDDEENDGDDDNREQHWMSWPHQGHRRGNWVMAHPPLRPHQPAFAPFRGHDLFHVRLPTLYNRSGPWKALKNMPAPQSSKQAPGDKRTAVVHNAPVVAGPSPPLKGEWEYLGKVLSSCPCRMADTEW